MNMIRSFPLSFDPDYEKGVVYHNHLKTVHPELGSEQTTPLDRQMILFGEKMKLPPISFANSNKALVNVFNTVLAQEYAKLSVFTYPTELFDTLYENSFGMDTIVKEDYIKTFYEWFRHNDLALLQKDVLLCPINYGYTWHLVAVDQPLNAVLPEKESNVYFVSSHQIVPQYGLAKLFTKYLCMAFAAMGYEAIPESFKYQELILEDYAHQSQVLLCVYTELAYKIAESKKDMSVYFSGIKPEVQRLKFEHYVFSRYVQTLLNCFAVEHNKHGQIPQFDVVVLEDEDLTWVEETDIDRILNPNRQMRVVRPIQRFTERRPPVSEWESYRRNNGNMERRQPLDANRPTDGVLPSTSSSASQ